MYHDENGELIFQGDHPDDSDNDDSWLEEMTDENGETYIDWTH